MRTLLEELEAIDAKLLNGTATEQEESRGQELVMLANSAAELKAALEAERLAHRQTLEALRNLRSSCK